MPNAINNQLLRLLVLALALATGQVVAAPGDVLFSDDFEDGTLANWSTTNASVSGVSSNPGYSGSGSFGAYTSNQPVTVTSPTINAAVPEARLQLWIRRGADSFSEDTDTNEDLVLEYRLSNGSWAPLRRYAGSGVNGQIYQESFTLPAGARHTGLAIRLRQTAGSGFDYDYWHFDNVRITEIAPALPLAVGTCDDFESGLSTNWSVSASGGLAGTSSATSSTPSNSLFLNGGVVSVSSNVIDTSDPTFSDLTLWIRRGDDLFSEDPDFAEDLVLEYLNDVGTWITLESFPGNGTSGQVLLRSYNLPVAGRHAGFRLRFRMTGGSGTIWDFWHVDDVCFDRVPFPSLQVTKTSQTVSDPISGGSNPIAIPGAYVEYTITVENQGPGPVDADSLLITDPLSSSTALYVDTGSGDPIAFLDGTTPSGLTYNYATDVSYSNQAGGGPPYSYSPVPDADGFDPAVTGIRIAPTGAMSGSSDGGSPSFSVTLRIRIE